MLKQSLVLMCLATMGAAANASADSSIFTCSTTSNGRNFNLDSRDPNFARDEVVRSCQRDSTTSNDECQVNVACNDGLYYSPMISCDTFSRGRSFAISSRDASFSSRKAIEKCQRDSYTSNAECSANIACEQPIPGPYPGPGPIPGPIGNGDIIQDFINHEFRNCHVQPNVSGYNQLFVNGNFTGNFETWRDDQRLRTKLENLENNGTCVRSVYNPGPGPIPGPDSRCPDPNTVFDTRLGRCVSRATPPRPIPAPRAGISCSIGDIAVVSRDRESAIQEVLNQCAASRRGYVCARSQVRCEPSTGPIRLR